LLSFFSDMTPDEIVQAILQAARQARDEEPRIGIANSHEWATVGRISVWLGRHPGIRALEQRGIFVDIE
jgi:replicative DNA helicase